MTKQAKAAAKDAERNRNTRKEDEQPADQVPTPAADDVEGHVHVRMFPNIEGRSDAEPR